MASGSGNVVITWCYVIISQLMFLAASGVDARTGPFLNIGGTSFRKGSTSSTPLRLFESRENFRGYVDCAVICGEFYRRSCFAYRYRHGDRVCELYAQGGGAVLDPAPGIPVFLVKYTDTFHVISYRGQLFSIYLSSVRRTFSQARTYCNQVGGYLLQYDSLEEYEVVDWVTAGPYRAWYFVGANDLDTEGVWVTDRGGVAIDPSLLLWYPGEPNNSGDEDCAMIEPSIARLYDSDCAYSGFFLCEKDLL